MKHSWFKLRNLSCLAVRSVLVPVSISISVSVSIVNLIIGKQFLNELAVCFILYFDLDIFVFA